MSLDNHETTSNNNNAQGAQMKNSENALFALLGQANLISSTHNITEVADVVKSLEETVKHLDKNTASEAQKLSLPRAIRNVTSDISPQLPGIALSTTVGSTAYVQPVLFFKVGVTEVTETIMLANEAMPRGIAKVPTSFMTQEVMEKVKTAYGFVDSKQMDKVVILSPMVLNLEAFIKNSVKYEDMIADVRNVILKEWNTGLYNTVVLDVAKAGATFPNPFKEGKLFGKDDAAVARIEPVNKQTIDGRPVPYNLAVKLATTNKQNTQNINSNNTKTIATTYLTVSLEAMSQPQFMQAKIARPGANVGPLVPVISTGITVPGETMNNNNSMLTALLGLYASIGANQMQFFSEAIRGKEVGHRGNLSNFNFYLSQILQGAYGTPQFITDKNITNANAVNDWLQRYVAPNAVYVLDLGSFGEDVSNSDFWWNVIGKQNGSTYHRALISLMDVLSGGAFSKLAQENANKPQRDLRKDWAIGDAILKPTNIIMPAGIAQGKDGKWFDLAEVDGMFLRQDNYYGNNEIAVNEYLGLICGNMGGDVKVRQFNIYNRLNSLFGTNVIVEGWKRRFVWEDAFFNTAAKAMASAGLLSMSASNLGAMWSPQFSNDYLTNTMTAVLQQGYGPGAMSMGGGYTHY